MSLDKSYNLQQWLQYLESLNPHKIQLGLERVQAVAERLQVNQFSCPVITVTGTNGKGSTVAFLESILHAAGYRVGAYTSPHLFNFNERIRLLNTAIDNEKLCEAFAAVEHARNKTTLTYFEFTTLAAFILFKQADLDVLILEVGLGGRLDAVNIIDADIAVITAIGIDHVEWLGADRESIGYEKAGIFRANKFVVCGDVNPPQSVLEQAEKLCAKLFCKGRDFFYHKNKSDWDWQGSQTKLSHLPVPILDIENAATALMVLQLLQPGLPADFIATKTGIQNAFLPARFQQLDNCIFDVAHNPQAAEWLANKLAQNPISGRTFAVVGMLADKDIPGTLRAMLPAIEEWHVADLIGPRAAKGELLAKALEQIGVMRYYNHPSIVQAYKTVQRLAGKQDRVVIFGSFYTIVEILKLRGEQWISKPNTVS
jgi:dihydrofolate synthase/folylpolyglutamate synthase